MLLTIDLNCDLGEGFGRYELGEDEQLLALISSANIACGFHAGDPVRMRLTVRRCIERGVAVGAHPGLPDLQGFGRREMAVSPQEAFDMVLYQIGALDAFVRAEGGVLHHVKPHGALYNMAARDMRLAEAITEAVYRFRPDLILYGLSGSRLIEAAKLRGLPYAEEAFADRTYRADGSLTSRSEPGAVLRTAEAAVRQALAIIRSGTVSTPSGEAVSLHADTLCVHGDGIHAVELLRQLRDALVEAGIRGKAPG